MVSFIYGNFSFHKKLISWLQKQNRIIEWWISRAGRRVKWTDVSHSLCIFSYKSWGFSVQHGALTTIVENTVLIFYMYFKLDLKHSHQKKKKKRQKEEEGGGGGEELILRNTDWIPWAGEPGRLRPWNHRVGHHGVTCARTCIVHTEHFSQ